MRTLNNLFENNRQWAADMEQRRPGFFAGLARQQAPKHLWIGCSDSRVPANEIVGMAPGELFVHRNVANLVVPMDLNCMAVVQYAIEVLKIEHIIVCGHYGCGGVAAALDGHDEGLPGRWLMPLRDVARKHRRVLTAAGDEASQLARLCELSVIEQVRSLGGVSAVRDAWIGGASLSLHGWIYDVADGLLRDLNLCAAGLDEADAVCDAAVKAVADGRQAGAGR